MNSIHIPLRQVLLAVHDVFEQDPIIRHPSIFECICFVADLFRKLIEAISISDEREPHCEFRVNLDFSF